MILERGYVFICVRRSVVWFIPPWWFCQSWWIMEFWRFYLIQNMIYYPPISIKGLGHPSNILGSFFYRMLHEYRPNAICGSVRRQRGGKRKGRRNEKKEEGGGEGKEVKVKCRIAPTKWQKKRTIESNKKKRREEERERGGLLSFVKFRRLETRNRWDE